MRLLSVILVVGAMAIVGVTWLSRRSDAERAVLLPPWIPIRISGPANTLASVAAAVNDPRRLAYDPAARKAVAHAPLLIDGELSLGRADDPASGEILELATEVCGDLRIEVAPGGSLRMYHSALRTVSQTLSLGACSRGYALFVDGSLLIVDSQVSYISGSQSEFLRAGSDAVIRRSTFSYCDGNALSMRGVDGRRVVVEGCTLLSSGTWGVVVHGQAGGPEVVGASGVSAPAAVRDVSRNPGVSAVPGEPGVAVEIRDCVIEGQLGAVFITGEDACVRLVDCVLSKGGIVFNGPSGQVEVAWTRRVRVVASAGGVPQAGVVVQARSLDGSAALAPIEGQTDGEGIAELVLPDWTARPGAATRREGVNTAGPFRLALANLDGQFVDAGPTLSVTAKDRVPIELAEP